MKFLIVTAIRLETEVVKKDLEDLSRVGESPYFLNGRFFNREVDILETGEGRQAVRQYLQNKEVDFSSYFGILVVGFCGGLSPQIRVGDICFTQSILGTKTEPSIVELVEDMDSILGELEFLLKSKKLSAQRVVSLTSDVVVTSAEERRNLFESLGAETVDMESYEWVAFAQRKHIPICVLRVAMDDCNSKMPKAEDEPYVQTLKKNPQLFLELKKQIKKASEELGQALPTTIEYLIKKWEKL